MGFGLSGRKCKEGPFALSVLSIDSTYQVCRADKDMRCSAVP